MRTYGEKYQRNNRKKKDYRWIDSKLSREEKTRRRKAVYHRKYGHCYS